MSRFRQAEPQPRRLNAQEMERLLSALRASLRQSDRDVAAEVDAYRSARGGSHVG